MLAPFSPVLPALHTIPHTALHPVFHLIPRRPFARRYEFVVGRVVCVVDVDVPLMPRPVHALCYNRTIKTIQSL